MRPSVDFDAEMDLIPDEDNAARIYERAFSEYVSTSASGESISEFIQDPTLFTTNTALADEFMAANPRALQSMRDARALRPMASCGQ